MTIRNATLADAKTILEIYEPFITDTCISFETEVPTIAEFTKRMESFIKSYPYLVCEADNKIFGIKSNPAILKLFCRVFYF